MSADYIALLVRVQGGDDDIPVSKLRIHMEKLIQNRFGSSDLAEAIFAYYEEADFSAHGFYEDFQNSQYDTEFFDSEWFQDQNKFTAENIYKGIRILLKLEYEPIPDVIEDDDNKYNNNNNKKPPLPRLIWNISRVEDARKYMNEQTFNTFDTTDGTVMLLISIGFANNLKGIVLLLADVYTKYYIKQMGSQLTDNHFCGPKITELDFCCRSPYMIGNFTPYQRENTVQDGIKSFLHRLMPMMHAIERTSSLIDDDINDYIQYTLMVQVLIHSEMQKTRGNSLLPLQVDLVILPKNSIPAEKALKGGKGISNPSNDSEIFPADISDLFVQFNDRYGGGDDSKFNHDCRFTEPMDISVKDVEARTLRKAFNSDVFCGDYHSKRFVIVIDRRRNGQKKSKWKIGKTRPVRDKCIIYQLPYKYSTIPADPSFENYISSSVKFMVPSMNSNMLSTPPYCGTGSDHNCQMFVISFQLMTAAKVRMQWYLNHGSVRFFPEYMIDVWPQCFNDIKGVEKGGKVVNGVEGPMHTLESIRNQWKLNDEDPVLEQWYEELAPKT